MKRDFSDAEVARIGALNDALIALEEEIWNRGRELEDLAKERLKCYEKEGMDEFWIELELYFYTTREQDEDGDWLELAHWNETCVSFDPDDIFGINDKACHNVTRGFIRNEALNAQRHCWLLHRLYDDYFVPWEDILRIDGVYYDLIVRDWYDKRLL